MTQTPDGRVDHGACVPLDACVSNLVSASIAPTETDGGEAGQSITHVAKCKFQHVSSSFLLILYRKIVPHIHKSRVTSHKLLGIE